jgi:hypothetical protein
MLPYAPEQRTSHNYQFFIAYEFPSLYVIRRNVWIQIAKTQSVIHVQQMHTIAVHNLQLKSWKHQMFRSVKDYLQG